MMSSNKVVWSEGMFLRPQHFQQEQRYVEALVEHRIGFLSPFGWGFDKLVLDEDLLRKGKVGIAKASGVFPDGTPFDIPGNTPAPPPVDIDEGCKEMRVVLTLPLRRAGLVEVDVDAEGNSTGRRYEAQDIEVRDACAAGDNTVVVRVASQNLRICLQSDQSPALTGLAFAHVVERRSDGRVLLSDRFIPPMLAIDANDALRNFMNEAASLVRHRARALAERIAQPGSGGVAEFADFLLLQTCNRASPHLRHLAARPSVHPEAMYRTFLELAGELGTFGSQSRLAMEFGPYRHDELWDTMHPVVEEIRKTLTGILERNAYSIPLQDRGNGYFLGKVADTTLFSNADFVFAVNASLPQEQIRSQFRTQVKIGSPEKIVELVKTQLPGVELHPLPVAPRQIPYHAGFVYFGLNRSNSLWRSMQTPGAIAMHVAGSFPGLEMELWAIRSR